MLRILPFTANLKDYPSDAVVINTTSRSSDWGRGLSPFILEGGTLYDGYTAKNVENAWQYSKVYDGHEENGQPSDAYFKWADNGWQTFRGIRYPMGRGAKPLYTYWNKKKYDYQEAKEKIYIRLYARSVKRTSAYKRLKEIYDQCQKDMKDLILLDFDAVDHIKLKLTLPGLVKQTKYKWGHATVLGLLLQEELTSTNHLI